MPVYADDATDLIESPDITDLVFITDDTIISDLEPIKSRLSAVDPDFIKSVESASPTQQLRMIRGYLAQKSFEYYDSKYTQLLQDASDSTGRTIKTENTDMGNEITRQSIWLDIGELDNGDLCYNLLERRACDYPTGFEEFRIDKDIGGTNQILNIHLDDKDANTHYEIVISLLYDDYNYESPGSTTQSFDNIVLRTIVTEYDYTKWYEWRNQEMADVRAGKYIPVPENEQPDSNSPFGRMSIKMDDSRQWKSNTIPSSRAHGRVRDYSQTSTYTTNNTNE